MAYKIIYMSLVCLDICLDFIIMPDIASIIAIVKRIIVFHQGAKRGKSYSEAVIIIVFNIQTTLSSFPF